MIDLVVDAAAVYRLWRLAAQDAITEPVRARFIRAAFARTDVEPGRPQPVPWPVTLLECPWCLSVYLAAAVLVFRRRFPRLWDPVARLLALSAACGTAATILEHLEEN